MQNKYTKKYVQMSTAARARRCLKNVVLKLEYLVVISFWLLQQSVRAPASSTSEQRERLGSNFKRIPR
jgi:hypothetical protein